MKYGIFKHNDKTYLSYNTWQMKGRTHGEMVRSFNVNPILGKQTPMKHKYNELLGCEVFIIEIKPRANA